LHKLLQTITRIIYPITDYRCKRTDDDIRMLDYKYSRKLGKNIYDCG